MSAETVIPHSTHRIQKRGRRRKKKATSERDVAPRPTRALVAASGYLPSRPGTGSSRRDKPLSLTQQQPTHIHVKSESKSNKADRSCSRSKRQSSRPRSRTPEPEQRGNRMSMRERERERGMHAPGTGRGGRRDEARRRRVTKRSRGGVDRPANRLPDGEDDSPHAHRTLASAVVVVVTALPGRRGCAHPRQITGGRRG